MSVHAHRAASTGMAARTCRKRWYPRSRSSKRRWPPRSPTRRSPPSCDRWLAEFAGRPTPVTHARRLSDAHPGAQIWLKREDLLHTGAHKLNNALGQVLLARRMGKRRIIAETGAGQHGVATATACAALGLGCVVYMGREDMRRQALNVYKMGLLGAEVVPVDSGSATLKDATNEAIRDWVAHVRDTHYVIGSAVGPHPYPSLVRRLQRVIGDEAREQMLSPLGRLPARRGRLRGRRQQRHRHLRGLPRRRRPADRCRGCRTRPRLAASTRRRCHEAAPVCCTAR